jgi:hypothetical protein
MWGVCVAHAIGLFLFVLAAVLNNTSLQEPVHAAALLQNVLLLKLTQLMKPGSGYCC